MSARYTFLIVRLMLSNRLVQFVIATIAAVLMLNGCKSSSTEPARIDFCAVYEPVLFDTRKDSPETINAIMQNNIIWAKFCDVAGEGGK